MSPFEVPDGPYTIESIMEAIRRQVVDTDSVAPGGEPAGGMTSSAPAANTDHLPAAANPLETALATITRLNQQEPQYRIRSYRRFLRYLIDPLKRVIHWGARPYTEVVRRRQDEWNAAAAEALRRILERFDEIEQQHAAMMRKFEAVAESFEIMTRRFVEDERLIAGVDERVAAIESRGSLDEILSCITPEERLAALDRTRGTWDDIWMRQKIYVDYFRNVPGQVLDIGCGRGELITMLRLEGIEVWGADLDPTMIEFARRSGVHAVVNDGLKELESVPPAGLGGLFASQVVEHLFPAQLAHLLRLARQRLARGGVMILETLNPSSLAVLAKSYYRDLDHKQPIHPEYLKQLVEMAGFESVELHYLHPFSPEEKPPLLPSAEELGISEQAHAALARRFEHIESLLYGAQDYYVVARQGEPEPVDGAAAS